MLVTIHNFSQKKWTGKLALNRGDPLHAHHLGPYNNLSFQADIEILFCIPISARVISVISSSVLIVVIKNATAKRCRFSVRIETNISNPGEESDMQEHTTWRSRHMLNQLPMPDPSGYLSRRLLSAS